MAHSPAAAPAIALRRVFQHVGPHAALKDISLTLAPGEALLLIGPNGAGKTLLTRLLVGLDRPSAGSVRVLGEDLSELHDRAMAQLRRRIGVVLQRGSLLDGLTVLENLLLPLRATPLDRREMARAARLVMTQLQLDGMENHRPRGLSLGQRRRVELGRALIHRPDLLVWDGLSDGLDVPGVREVLEVLQVQQRDRGLTLLATDNSTLAPLGDAERIAVMDRGRILFDGDRAALEQAVAASLELRYVLEGHP